MIGYKFFSYAGAYWRDNQGGIFPLSPPLKLHHISRSDARDILKKSGRLFVRWESEFDSMASFSWWHVIKDSDCSMEGLSGSTRSKVRRGLKQFVCAPESLEKIRREGYSIYRDAFARYQTHEKKYDENEFDAALVELPLGTEFWGVRERDSGRLVAFSENYVENSTCFYNTIWFRPDSLKKYSSYALFYEMNREYLDKRNFLYVSDGARSLSHRTNIHDFLQEKFGFRKAYARLNVVYVTWLSLAVKAAFPFRGLIWRIPYSPFRKAAILLKHEAIHRECQKERMVRGS